LRALRQTRGISQVELARMIGRHQTVIGPYERDEYEPSREVVEKLAIALESSPEYLYFGRSPQQTAITVVGRIGGAGLLDADSAGGMVSLRETQFVGYRLDDDSMTPVYRPGQLILVFAAAGAEPARLLGRDVLAELEDGRLLFRRLMPGTEPRRFDLAGYNAPPLLSVAVRSARLVAGALAPEASGDSGAP
jgi:transcriptional regulator with XRE-family HTH domain